MSLLLQHLSIIQVMLTLQIIILLVLMAQNHEMAKVLRSIDQNLKCRRVPRKVGRHAGISDGGVVGGGVADLPHQTRVKIKPQAMVSESSLGDPGGRAVPCLQLELCL